MQKKRYISGSAPSLVSLFGGSVAPPPLVVSRVLDALSSASTSTPAPPQAARHIKKSAPPFDTSNGSPLRHALSVRLLCRPPTTCQQQEQLAPLPFPPGATSQNVREPPPHSMMRGRSATLHSGGGEATPYCGAAAAAASHQDDAADPYATFPYADPRKQRAEPSSLELALAKIMRGYLRASSDDLSSLSQTSLDSEPLRVRVHVRDAEAQTERASTRNACVSTTTLPPSTPSRRFLASLEPPTLSKARSLSSLSPSLSHWREETSTGCERCASPSPPCLSPCGSPPTRRGHPRPGSSNLVDWGRSLSLSQFLVRAGGSGTRRRGRGIVGRGSFGLANRRAQALFRLTCPVGPLSLSLCRLSFVSLRRSSVGFSRLCLSVSAGRGFSASPLSLRCLCGDGSGFGTRSLVPGKGRECLPKRLVSNGVLFLVAL